jgi:hypothetical protein
MVHPLSRRDFDPVDRTPLWRVPEGALVRYDDRDDDTLYVVTGSVFDPELGALVELRLPDGRLVYGIDPALPATDGQSTPD